MAKTLIEKQCDGSYINLNQSESATHLNSLDPVMERYNKIAATFDFTMIPDLNLDFILRLSGCTKFRDNTWLEKEITASDTSEAGIYEMFHSDKYSLRVRTATLGFVLGERLLHELINDENALERNYLSKLKSKNKLELSRKLYAALKENTIRLEITYGYPALSLVVEMNKIIHAYKDSLSKSKMPREVLLAILTFMNHCMQLAPFDFKLDSIKQEDPVHDTYFPGDSSEKRFYLSLFDYLLASTGLPPLSKFDEIDKLIFYPPEESIDAIFNEIKNTLSSISDDEFTSEKDELSSAYYLHLKIVSNFREQPELYPCLMKCPGNTYRKTGYKMWGRKESGVWGFSDDIKYDFSSMHWTESGGLVLISPTMNVFEELKKYHVPGKNVIQSNNDIKNNALDQIKNTIASECIDKYLKDWFIDPSRKIIVEKLQLNLANAKNINQVLSQIHQAKINLAKSDIQENKHSFWRKHFKSLHTMGESRLQTALDEALNIIESKTHQDVFDGYIDELASQLRNTMVATKNEVGQYFLPWSFSNITAEKFRYAVRSIDYHDKNNGLVIEKSIEAALERRDRRLTADIDTNRQNFI